MSRPKSPRRSRRRRTRPPPGWEIWRAVRPANAQSSSHHNPVIDARLDFTPVAKRHCTHCSKTKQRGPALTDGATSRTSLTLASTLASVHTVEETALEFARSAGFSPDISSNLAMVAREASVNAVVHGNRYDLARRITASFEITSSALIIRIADQGEGLDPTAIPDPLAPENLLRSSGRGVFLMRAFMDEVNFRDLHPGTEITLIKRR